MLGLADEFRDKFLAQGRVGNFRQMPSQNRGADKFSVHIDIVENSEGRFDAGFDFEKSCLLQKTRGSLGIVENPGITKVGE